jgi:hypothetical protein
MLKSTIEDGMFIEDILMEDFVVFNIHVVATWCVSARGKMNIFYLIIYYTYIYKQKPVQTYIIAFIRSTFFFNFENRYLK